MTVLRSAIGAMALAAGIALAAGPALAASSFDPPSPARDTRMVDAEKAVQAKDWNKAIGLLNRVVADSPKNADAYNYLGYSHRKLGNRDQALSYYNAALSLDPNHRGALEYLGELYLDMKDLPKAEEQLTKLSRVCGPRCGEYRDLRDQVEKFKNGQPRS
jgi:tetratricopeptide (TPR) repeat protein